MTQTQVIDPKTGQAMDATHPEYAKRKAEQEAANKGDQDTQSGSGSQNR